MVQLVLLLLMAGYWLPVASQYCMEAAAAPAA